jgi:hypothetical protein
MASSLVLKLLFRVLADLVTRRFLQRWGWDVRYALRYCS